MTRYFIDEEEVSRERFVKEWDLEGYEDQTWDGKIIPYPAPDYGRWGIKKVFSVRAKK